MSEHRIRARDPSHKVVVGWNPTLRLYFCDVNANGNKKHFASTDLVILAASMKPWAYLSNDMREQLRTDQENNA